MSSDQHGNGREGSRQSLPEQRAVQTKLSKTAGRGEDVHGV